jgi:hypothetical protein
VRPEQFAVMRRGLSERLISVLVRLFFGLGSWRDRDVDRFLAQAVPALQGSQRSLAALTAAFVAAQAGEALGRTFAPPGVADVDAVDLRAGIDVADVYARPFKAVYAALAQGKSLTAAVEAGRVRLTEIAEMDMQQTYARASRAAMRGLPEQARPRFWRRTLQGEENCALCVITSTQRYRIEALNPIHPGCDCQVQAIYGRDPGQVIEPALLEQVHDAVQALTGEADRGGRAPDYKHLTVQMTREHGELGALLVRPNDRFTGPGDLRAS